ncbi:hypothetical protein SEVCU120_1140 [Staphylococcus epidermidis VCU120]|nr:hypothetical protein SEVCU120_1140 [Staphylococcus epidermidis VCU120]EZI11832.1 hypothetical protein SEVCU014_0645 [Staphylococcus epidermidis VCU014]KDP64612.1 hypothetical protein SEVCU013_1497 [Staphylococcus epidermidis VCU013]DAO39324.1 MAG TPA: hypothetical protein [Caudoviricetes sp.]
MLIAIIISFSLLVIFYLLGLFLERIENKPSQNLIRGLSSLFISITIFLLIGHIINYLIKNYLYFIYR